MLVRGDPENGRPPLIPGLCTPFTAQRGEQVEFKRNKLWGEKARGGGMGGLNSATKIIIIVNDKTNEEI